MPFYFLDTEHVYKNAIVTIARRFGKTYTNEIAAKVIGTVEPESARIAVTEMKLPIPVEDFRKEFRTTSHVIFAKHGASIMPGTISRFVIMCAQFYPFYFIFLTFHFLPIFFLASYQI